jgi:ribosomal protein S6--L-glutamate ligase
MNIIILSRNPSLYSTQSLLIAGRRRGHYMRVLDHMNVDLILDKNGLEIYYQNELIEGINAVIPRIGATVTSYGAAVVRQFESMGVYSTLHHEALLRSRDKVSSLQLLAANGIGVPRTVLSNNPYVIPEMIEHAGSIPLIIKMINGTHGIGVILSETQQNAESILESFYKLKERIILQEFVKESNGTDIRVFVVDGQIVGAMERKAKEGEFRSNLHRGGSARLIPLSHEEKRVSIEAAKILGLDVCGIDLLRSNQGPLVLEVNPSPGLEGIERTTNVDIAARIIQLVERNSNT